MLNIERKVIGIISGKGGVGKTSLSASLASLTIEDPDIEAIILDCDVDAPNLGIILPPKSESSIIKQDIFTTLKATFIEAKCIHCKQCVDEYFCEFNALEWDYEKKQPKINYLACEGCGACRALCLEKAFDIKAVKSGEIISYESEKDLNLVYGETRLGSTTSGKLVSDVKEFAQNLETFNETNLVLIDGPPGIGCPVIATISGLDYVITITEPTPSGLHDLIRAIDLITQFKIPFSIVINKFDLVSPFRKKFKKFINKTNYKILGMIPFDLSIPKAMSYAKPVIDFNPDTKASLAIKEIYSNLKKELWSKNLT